MHYVRSGPPTAISTQDGGTPKETGETGGRKGASGEEKWAGSAGLEGNAV
jgi:hypothetical protein